MANSVILGIYKITSPSGKVYIGQSTNIEKREKDYKKLNCKGQIKLYNSLHKYGWEQHEFKVIEECKFEELNIRERYWQDYYDVIGKNGMNCILTETNKLPRVTSQETKLKKSIVLKKYILQYDLEGNFIQEWFGIKNAMDILKITSISQNLSGVNNYAGNFIFKFKENEIIEKKINIIDYLKGKYKIIQLDLNGLFIKEYDNVKQAQKETKITSIYKCLSGQNKTAGGYLWLNKLRNE